MFGWSQLIKFCLAKAGRIITMPEQNLQKLGGPLLLLALALLVAPGC